MFTEEQIQEIVDIIDFQSNFFIAGNISNVFLSHKDKLFLTKLGIDYKTLMEGFTPVQQVFYFGRLAAILGPLKAKDVDLENFKKYLRRGQFRPLTKNEQATLNYLEEKTFSHIKDLTTTIKTTIVNKIKEVELINREGYEKIIKNAVKKTVFEKRVVSDMVSEIGSKTKDWQRDLGRIAETELQSVFEYGKLTSLNEQYGDKIKIYKHVYGGACQHCIRLFLTNGVGSAPKVFTYKELLENGTNIGRKVKDWKPVLGAIHPFCRCDGTFIREGDEWDEEKKAFLPKKQNISPGAIKISVGDKNYVV